MKIHLIVIRTKDPEILKKQYELLGMQFEYHRHGNGPYHFASETNGVVFEIYPLSPSMTSADKSLRLGFEVQHISDVVAKLQATNWVIKSTVKQTEWGLTAVIQDLDGRKIELKEVES